MPDMDGYPTDEELEKISNWKVFTHDLTEFMAYIKSLWQWEDFIWREGPMYVLATGGWSGNEDIIAAMQQNTMFWMFFWESSERGGRYKFCDLKLAIDWEEGNEWLI